MTDPFTQRPSSDPIRLYQYRDGLYAVDLLTAAMVEFDFFSRFDARGMSPEEVCALFGFAPRPADVLLTLCAANGFLVCEEGRWHLTATAREHLCSSSPWNLRPYFESLHHRPIAQDFVTVLRTGKPAGWSGDQSAGDWHRAMEEEGFARKFTAAMDCRGHYLAPALAGALDLSGVRRLLDIGGGSGVYACALAAANPHLEAVVFDQPPVDRIAATLIAERGFSGRVKVSAGDMFAGLPEGCDAHLFSNVLHDWDEPEAARLLACSREALPAGGLLIIHDAFINAAKDGPLHAAEYSALLMHSTQGKCYSTAEYSTLLDAAGFEPGPYHHTAAARGVMTARRR
jgi:acetylserotonin N-methyltransferase